LDLVPATSGQEPTFVVSAVAFSTPGRRIPDSRSVADAFLKAHPQLRPGWPSATQVQPAAQGQTVLYQREFDLRGGKAAQVDSSGSPAGLRIDVAGGSVTGAAGPIPVALQSSDYQSRSSQQAAGEAVAAPPATASGPTQVPSFQLSNVSLVYMAVGGGEYGYFVPAYLFTGTTTSDGQTLEKRVVVPALDPSQLG
ncbi:MAG: hypothetical protein M3170_12290, partial [Candidatus Dormibacteraeota bacterium]|nr:hypothetical protein [Candidatus Dormibacteraeota bacterium]